MTQLSLMDTPEKRPPRTEREKAKDMEKKPCACGCGDLIPSVDARGRPRTYAIGHQQKEAARRRKYRNGFRCSPNPSGLCMCGCGESTTIASRTTRPFRVDGEPNRFVRGHQNRVMNRGKEHWAWNGGVMYHDLGYRLRHRPAHPKSTAAGYVREHRLVAERALGKPLPERAVVHHVNGDVTDNRPQNLVICEDNGYHHVLHARERALDECGHADWLRCRFCGGYSPADDPGFHVSTTTQYHRECSTEYSRKQWQRQKASK